MFLSFVLLTPDLCSPRDRFTLSAFVWDPKEHVDHIQEGEISEVDEHRHRTDCRL